MRQPSDQDTAGLSSGDSTAPSHDSIVEATSLHCLVQRALY